MLGMVLYWLPFILWSQNVIPERQTATISALVVATVMVVVQYVATRWLARKNKRHLHSLERGEIMIAVTHPVPPFFLNPNAWSTA